MAFAIMSLVFKSYGVVFPFDLSHRKNVSGFGYG